jgi:hypothetical protein
MPGPYGAPPPHQQAVNQIPQGKEKEKKWTKWFKNHKASTLSKIQPGLKSPPIGGPMSPPIAGQMQHPGYAGQPHPAGAPPNPNPSHNFVQAGQPMGTLPQAGVRHSVPVPPATQWQSAPTAYRPDAPPQGMPGMLSQRASSYGGLQQGPPRAIPAAAPGGGTQADASSSGFHFRGVSISGPVQSIGSPGHPSNAQLPNNAVAQAQATSPPPPSRPQEAAASHSNRHVVNPRDALGSHPPNRPTPSTSHSHTPSNVSQVSLQSGGSHNREKSDSSLAPAPLFANNNGPKPRTPPPTAAPVSNPEVAETTNKWATRPAADYSGGDWGA